MVQNIIERNNVKIFGKGSQPLMFAHGFGCDQNMWRFIYPNFENEFQIILFDYVGSGKSDLSAYTLERYSKLEGYTEDILDICNALELSNVTFIGHSVSSMIGLLASIQIPSLLSRLIMIGPSPRYINDPPDYVGGFERADIEGILTMMDKNYIGWANYLAPAIMQNAERPYLAKELNDSFCSTDPIIARQFAQATFFSDNRCDLRHLKIPSLVLQCSEDIIAPLEVGEYVHQNLPNNILKIMKATGHCPHLSHPNETIQLIKEYLCGTYSS